MKKTDFSYKGVHSLCAVVISFMLLSLTGCFLMPAEKEEVEVIPASAIQKPDNVIVDTYDVRKGSIDNTVSFWGLFLSPATYKLNFKTPGNLKAIYTAQGDQVTAGELLAELDTADIEQALDEARINLEKVQLNYERLENDFEAFGATTKYDLDQAGLDVRASQITVDSTREKLEKSRVTSPIAGIVTYVKETENGTPVDFKSDFIVVADKSQAVLVCKKSENLSQLKPGMKVSVKYNDRTYTGEIYKMPDATMNEPVEQMQGTIQIKVSGLNAEGLKLEDTAMCSVDLGKVENVLIINKNDVIEESAKQYVKVLDNGIIVQREIKTGLLSSNKTDIEVIKGLAEGDKIVPR